MTSSLNTQADVDAITNRYHYSISVTLGTAKSVNELVYLVTEYQVVEVGDPTEGRGRVFPVRTAERGTEEKALELIQLMRAWRAKHTEVSLKYAGLVL